jgi:cobalt-zinc-cadmium efflux system outer membrane protein
LLALAYTARRAFFRQQAAEQTVELESNALAAADAAREATRALHEAGNTTDLDWAQREAAYLEASVKVRSAKAAASAQREQLLGVLGLAASESKVRIGGPLQSLPEHEPDWSAAERNANEHSLAIASAEQKRRAAELRHDAATVRSVLPHLGAGVGAEREENRWGTGPLVELELPLFYQGQAERASTLSDERAFSALRDQAALDVHATCRAVLERLSASRQRVLLYEQELLPMRQRVLDEALLQYNAMSMGVYQLLEMQRALTATQVAHLSALLDYWLQRTDLEQLLAGSKLATAASDGAAPSEVSQMGTGHGH